MSDTQAQETIRANHDPLIDVKEVNFSFRKSTDQETGVETKRPNITGRINVPSVEGIVKILETGGKELELLQSAVEQVLVDFARSLINDDTSINTDNFPTDKISWAEIANQPDSDRRGRGIAKEVWEDFIKSYIETMPAVSGMSLDVIKKQATILAGKFQLLKNHEKKNDILPKFVEMLSLYANNVSDADQFAAPLEFLLKKAEEFMNTDSSANLVENLGF